MLTADCSAYRIFVRRPVVFVQASDISSESAHWGYELRNRKALFNEVPGFKNGIELRCLSIITTSKYDQLIIIQVSHFQ